MSDPVPAKIALVSVLIFVSSSPSVNSSNKSLDLKNLLCFGSFKTLFVRNCLKICLQIKNYYMYIQSKRNSNRPKNWALLSDRIQTWVIFCIKSKLLRVTCDIFSLRWSQSSKVCRLWLVSSVLFSTPFPLPVNLCLDSSQDQISQFYLRPLSWLQDHQLVW